MSCKSLPSADRDYGTNLELENGCGKAFTLVFPVSLFESNAEITNFLIREFVLSANSTIFPALVILFQLMVVPSLTLNTSFAVSTVFSLHVDTAKVWVVLSFPILMLANPQITVKGTLLTKP